MKINKILKRLTPHLLILFAFILTEIFIIKKFLNLSVIPPNIRILIYLLFVLPVALIYAIIFLVYNLFGKYKVRRGGRFQAKLILIFILVSLIPTIPLIILSNNLINKTIELWLTKSIEEALNSSLNLISNFIDEYKSNLSDYSENLSKEKIIKYCIIFGADNKSYLKGIKSILNRYKIDAIFILDKELKVVFQVQYKYILKQFYNKEILNKILNGLRIVEIMNEQNIEYIIAGVPVYDEREQDIIGILLITKILPQNFSLQANKIALALQSYKQMELYKKPVVKGFTTIIILSVSLLIIFISILVSYFISKGITEPIKILLDGTRRIASGNLDFEINYNKKDEFKILINAFNQMTKDLKVSKQALYNAQRIAAWREIAQKIAHEIKNPLTPIKLSAERLRKKYNSPDFEKILNKSVDVIISEVDNLNNLVNEFSSFARMPKLNLKPENLNHIIYETLNLYEGVVNVKFIKELEKDLPPLNLDKDQIKEVIINLINNSINAIGSRNDGVIILRTYSKNSIFGEFVYFEIEDNGIGIAPEIIDRIFEPHFTTRKDGSGLGLHIVEQIITEHRGRIRCESEKGKGTKFIIEFNLAV